MNLKKVTAKLAKVRDSIKEHGGVSTEDEAALQELVQQTIACAKTELSSIPMKSQNLPKAHNDNKPLNKDQRYRLSLIEKTGTGSAAIH